MMRRRISQRARTDCPVRTTQGSLVSLYRAVEVSPTGLVIDRGRPIQERDERLLIDLEIALPERHRPLRALARPVWSFGTQQAFKFVKMSDADRLNLAEHVDLAEQRSRILN